MLRSPCGAERLHHRVLWKSKVIRAYLNTRRVENLFHQVFPKRRRRGRLPMCRRTLWMKKSKTTTTRNPTVSILSKFLIQMNLIFIKVYKCRRQSDELMVWSINRNNKIMIIGRWFLVTPSLQAAANMLFSHPLVSYFLWVCFISSLHRKKCKNRSNLFNKIFICLYCHWIRKKNLQCQE